MTPERWRIVKSLLSEVLEQPVEARAAYIERSTSDPDLRSELESLLGAHEVAESDRLESPAACAARSLDPLVGRRLGAYLILGELGVGGMGEVYRAIRDDSEYRQDVAIKLLRAVSRSRAAIVRFRQERQILATLAHPNIARLLDGGTTKDGIPYLVMERIDGQPINDFCNARMLDVDARLRLFLEVCAAVQYAHQHLIVHRDLKPANVFVTREGTPKLLDFGIAKCLEPVLAESPAATATLMQVFTPEYASPEQLLGQPITTASDVYSLGVVLYELLTGARPYQLGDRLPHELVRAVCDSRPVRPSTAVKSRSAPLQSCVDGPASGPTIPAGAGSAQRLSRRLAGDLDNIVLMALRKDPARRYGSVEALAQDVRAHLEHRPVSARGDALGYVFAKFVSRHRLGVGLGIAATLSAIAAAFVLAATTRTARWERAEAERARNAAQLALAEQYEQRAWESMRDGYRLQAARYALEAVSAEPTPSERFHALLAAQLSQPEAFMLRHGGPVEGGAFSADGSRVLTMSRDHTSRVWDVSTGRLITRLQHEKTVWRGMFSPDGLRVVTASDDTTARIWDARSGREILRLKHGDRVEDAKFSPDGSLVTTASMDATARVWDARSGALRAVLRHGAGVWRAVFSPDGTRIATASVDKTARVFDVRTGRELLRLRHDDGVVDVHFSADGRWIVTASRDRSARVWDAATGRAVSRLVHGQTVWSAVFSPDGARVVTASNDRTARLWDADSGRELWRIQSRAPVEYAGFSPDGRDVVTSSGNALEIWDAGSGHELARLQHDAEIWGPPVFSPDGTRLLSVSDDRTARIWQVWSGPEIARVTLDGDVYDAVFTPDGTRVVTASWDRTLRVWDARNGREILRRTLGDRLASAVVSPDGRRVLAASMDGTAHMWDLASGREQARLVHRAGLWQAVYSADGSRALTTSMDWTARLWDGQTGKLLAVLQHAAPVRGAAFSPDGTRVATASDDDTARIWDTASGRELLRLPHRDAVWTVSFSRDGGRVVTASYDGTAIIWDAKTGRPLVRVRHGGRVPAASFSPDGETIVTASADGTARVWDARNGRAIAQLQHEEGVESAVFSPDGTEIATASDDGTARIWSSATGVELVRFQHDYRVNSVAFSADGSRLVTASEDDTARVWSVSLARLPAAALAARACTLLLAAAGRSEPLPAICSRHG